MAFLEHDASGLHTVTLDREAQTIQFDREPPRWAAIPPIGVRLSADGELALFEHGETGWCYVVRRDGSALKLAPTTGLYTAAWMPDNTVAIQRADQTGVDIFTIQGQWLRTVPAPYSATGIAYVTPQGEIVMTTDPRCTRTINGVNLFNVSESPDGWLVGLGDGALGGVIIRVSPQGVMEMSPVQTQLPPRVAQGGVCCWSGQDAPVTVTAWMPYQPPVVIVTPPPNGNDLYLPLPLSTYPAAFVGRTDGLGMAGNCEWGVEPSTAYLGLPVGEGVDYKATVQGRDLLVAKWSTEPAAGGFPNLDRTMGWAKERHCAVELHCDRNGQDRPMLMDARQRVLSNGLVPILMAHCVENASDFEADARSFAALGKWGITINFRVLDKDLDAFREAVITAGHLHTELLPTLIWFFDYRHAGPQMQRYANEYFRLTPKPATRPDVQDAPLPPNDPPPWQVPDTPLIKKDKPKRKSIPW